MDNTVISTLLLSSSIISLATRCAMPSFRMHLRARGKVAQVFKMLSDAPQHPVRHHLKAAGLIEVLETL